MKKQAIPDDIKKFIENNIDSVTKLELLILISKNPEKSWSATEVNRVLRSNDELVIKYLKELCYQKLFSCDSITGSYKYRSENLAQNRLVQDLIQLYSIYQVRIIQMIYEKPISTLQQFADAFKLRKDDDDDHS